MIGCPFEGPGELREGTEVGFVRSGEGTKKLSGAPWKMGKKGLEAAHTILPLSTVLSLPVSQSCEGSSRSPGLRSPCALHLSQCGPARNTSQLG